MTKKVENENEYKKAFDRWVEEVDITEFVDSNEAYEDFSGWLNPESGKNEGLDNLEEYFKQRFKEQIESLPTESKIWFEWAEKVEIPLERKEIYREAFKLAIGEADWRKAWGKFYGNLPYRERFVPEAKLLWQAIYKLFK